MCAELCESARQCGVDELRACHSPLLPPKVGQGVAATSAFFLCPEVPHVIFTGVCAGELAVLGQVQCSVAHIGFLLFLPAFHRLTVVCLF